MPAKTYRIRLDRGDTHFEAEGDKAFVLQMLKRFGEGGSSPVEAVREGGKPHKEGRTPPPKTLSLAKGVSVGECIKQFDLKKHTDLVLPFGYYLEQHARLKDFTPADINNCYYEAKIDRSNTSQMIVQDIRRGFLMAAKGQKGAKQHYTLTRSGEDFVKAALIKVKKA